jgi:hypothetical protein
MPRHEDKNDQERYSTSIAADDNSKVMERDFPKTFSCATIEN